MELKANKVYQHKSGKLYTLLAVSNLEATKDGWGQQAVYIDEQYTVWTRPAKEFEEKMTPTNLQNFATILTLSDINPFEQSIKDPDWIVKYPENGL
jgi:hypothetical protein